ncbi:MAG: hypothetical protein JRH11_07200, partial [Deltaproteobacteria bacterium]|nr:hypothetical protein [Deltaproteobacteria bacterium]
MDLSTILGILVPVGVGVFMLFGIFALIARFYRKIDQDHALVINPMTG